MGAARCPRPPARSDAVMASLNGTVVLFGGVDVNGNDLADTWTWNGTVWTQPNVKGPSARSQAVMSSLNDALVLFGGVAGSLPFLSDTWGWNGAAWTPLAGSGQPAPLGPAMAPLDGTLVLLGDSADHLDVERHPMDPAQRAGTPGAGVGCDGAARQRDRALWGARDSGNGGLLSDTWTWNLHRVDRSSTSLALLRAPTPRWPPSTTCWSSSAETTAVGTVFPTPGRGTEARGRISMFRGLRRVSAPRWPRCRISDAHAPRRGGTLEQRTSRTLIREHELAGCSETRWTLAEHLTDDRLSLH